MPGNKFVNGILFGVAEVMAMVLSNLLLIYLEDVFALKIVFIAGIISYLVVIFCHEESSPFLVHSAIMILVGSIGSWMNINLLILELRVPSKNVASAQLLSRTIAVGFGVLSPTIASLEPPYPYLILVGVSVTGFLASLRLPKAGYHMPKTFTQSDDLEPQI